MYFTQIWAGEGNAQKMSFPNIDFVFYSQKNNIVYLDYSSTPR